MELKDRIKDLHNERYLSQADITKAIGVDHSLLIVDPLTGNMRKLQKLIGDFYMFRDHCIIIRRNYNTYNDLFFSDVDKLLIKTAPAFFNDIAEIMSRDWLLQVCKIMDPSTKKMKGIEYETISIELLNTQLKKENLLTDQTKKLSSQILAYGDLIKPARNKRITHFDRNSAVSGIVLGDHDKESLSNFLAHLQQYCDEVGRAIGVGPLDFSASGCKGDVRDLIMILRQYFEVAQQTHATDDRR